ncbi:MAG: SusC/RagA family TonB-linked outer membrane protein [Chitinophagaceae bacterium]|nr:SusC/RagA family TonB-linked outer membrane protein [Chitinophagaceae bacterium]
MSKFFAIFATLMLTGAVAFSQTHSVRGVVTGPNGQPVPGIAVQVVGSTTGTTTDANGQYELNVSRNATLDFTGVGFNEQKIEVRGRSVINLAMTQQVTTLNEIVVTALGISREKKALGYSTQSLSSDQLTKGANPNLAQALEGKLSGVEVRPSSGMPGASTQIFIRGARFFDGNNAPLYVVDGMPINSNPDFSVGGNGVTGTDYSSRSIDIDPNDIASISVLKGQAASALYGMRASNGVIMITTKSGQGIRRGKPVVSVSTNSQFDDVSRLPDLQHLYAQGSAGAFSQTASTSWGPLITDLPNNPTYGGNVPNQFNNNNPTSQTQGKYWNIKKGEWVTPQVYNNPQQFFETGYTAANNVSIAQNGDFGSYSIGLGATNQSGIIPSSSMNRYNTRFSGNFNASKKIKVGANVNLSSTAINKMPSGNNSYLFEIYGAPVSYDLKGTPIHVAGNNYKQIQYRGGTFDNPYWGTQFNKFNEVTRRVFGNAFINYNPIRDLTIRYQVGTDQYTTDRTELFEFGSGPFSTGNLTNGSLVNRSFNSLFTATYNKQINDNWHINALVGNEINDNYLRNIAGNGNGFIIPGFDNISNASTQTTSEAVFKNRTVGFFAQAGADWKSMVFLNVTGRNDIVSTMPPDNRSFFYPSVSLSWVFSQLNGLNGHGFYGKLRGSYAQVGAPGTFIQPVYVKGGSGSGFLQEDIEFPFNGVVGFQQNPTLYDPDLKPQNTNSFEVGTDLGFFNNRIRLQYTYSHQKTIDQIFSIPMAGSTGFSQIVRNAGNMQSNVHEATLTLVPVKSRNFEWDLTGNFTKIINKVIALAPGVDNIYLGGFVDPQVRAAIGFTYPSIYGTTFLKNAQGQVEIDDDPTSPTYGMPLAGSDGVIGSVTPKFTLGVNNEFSYKSLHLSFLVDWQNGGQMYSGLNRLINLYGTSALTGNRGSEKMVIPGVKASTVGADGKGGTANDIVITGANNFQTLYGSVYANISEANIYKTSFVKLRDVALTLDVPHSAVERTRFISAASVTVAANNILLWTALPNADPESSQGNGNMQGGFDYMSLPQTRSISVGLNLTF